MMKIFLLRFLLLFLCCFQLAYAADVSEEYFVHRDQFFLGDSEGKQKKSFYQQLHLSNVEQSQKIRDYKSQYSEERRNILLVSLHVFYDDQYEYCETKESPKVFLSGWLPISERLPKSAEDIKNMQDFFKKEPFCLGSAYEGYAYFDNATRILNIKRKEGHLSLSQSIQANSDFHPYEGAKKSNREKDANFTDTFIHKLIQDFAIRGIDFEFSGGDVYNPQNHAHSEQAFFSCVQNSLTLEEIFTREDIPKSILVNMISYLPTCSMGFCLRAIRTLLSSDQFKSQFLQKIMPNLYAKHRDDWMNAIKDIHINFMFTPSDLPSSPDVNFITQNGILFRAFN